MRRQRKSAAACVRPASCSSRAEGQQCVDMCRSIAASEEADKVQGPSVLFAFVIMVSIAYSFAALLVALVHYSHPAKDPAFGSAALGCRRDRSDMVSFASESLGHTGYHANRRGYAHDCLALDRGQHSRRCSVVDRKGYAAIAQGALPLL